MPVTINKPFYKYENDPTVYGSRPNAQGGDDAVAFSKPEDFFAAGGSKDFSNVQVLPAGTPINRSAALDAIRTDLNNTQNDLFTAGGDASKRASTSIQDNIDKAAKDAAAAKDAYDKLNVVSRLDEYNRLRTEKGVPQTEADLLATKDAERNLEGDLRGASGNAGTLTEGLFQQNLAERQRPLLLKEQTLNDRLSLSNTDITNRLTLRQDDVNNAERAYNASRSSLGDMLSLYKDTAPTNLQVDINPITGMGTAIMRNPITGEIYKKDMGYIGAKDELLSPTEAASLGVPYGTTKQAAAKQGLVPKSQLTGTDKINTEIKLSNDFEGFAKPARTSQVQISRINQAYQAALDATKKGASLNAASQGVLVEFQKLLDPTSVVRESEYARSGEGQSILAQLQGKLQQVLQGGAGVTAENLKEFVDLANQFNSGYQSQLLQFAQRTQQQADSYGLNISNILTPDILHLLGQQNQPSLTPLDANILQGARAQGFKVSPLLLKYPYVEVDKLLQQYPDATEQEIRDTLGLTSVGTDTNAGAKPGTGSVSTTGALKTRNLNFAPAITIPKVTIGAGAAVRNNNPGNLRDSDGSWIKFKTPEEGFKGLMGYLERAKAGDHPRYNKNQTLYQFFAIYAPAADSNNPKKYAEDVARHLGISPNTPIGQVDTFRWAAEIARHESSTKVGQLI